jgi:DNA-binding HxlR family transcriptional regulator
MEHSASVTDCRALGQTIDRIADKWAVIVVGHLSSGQTIRFNGLMRAIPGVFHRMLTLTLRALQRDGIVKRTAFPTIPPRVDYVLTQLGVSLTMPLSALADWARAHREAIAESRAFYDAYDTEGSVHAN